MQFIRYIVDSILEINTNIKFEEKKNNTEKVETQRKL
jgi:hypothetical protein